MLTLVKKSIQRFNSKGILICMLGLLVCLFFPTGGHPAEKITDQDITGSVEMELLVNENVISHLIDVETRDGIVTLSGSTANLLSKEKATEVAGTVRGVKAVVNTIKVKAEPRTDTEILNDVEKALTFDPATEAYEVSVAVSDGIVTLNGQVESFQEKRLAGLVAKSVRGVENVNNRITIDIETNRPDSEIKSDIIGRLRANPWIDEKYVDVKVNNGSVILDGHVGSAVEYRKAMYDAWVAGVSSVNTDSLKINWLFHDEMKKEYEFTSMNDKEIREAVRKAMFYDPRVSSTNVKIAVTNGIVTLKGVVDNLRARTAAENDARNTQGVISVNNYIKVRPSSIPPDDDLELKVLETLARDPYVETFGIEVKAINGLVYLDGQVNTTFERQHAADVASRVDGVVNIVNMIDSRYVWTWQPDREIRRQVIRQIDWSPFVDTSDITVGVDEGVVTLEGEVNSYLVRNIAERNAYEGGAKEVNNFLIVNYYKNLDLSEGQ